MAPDLNSVPSSPRPPTQSTFANSNTRALPLANAAPTAIGMSTTRSRRASQQMPPPTLPLGSPTMNVLPSNQSAVGATSAPPALIAVPASASSNSLPVGIGGAMGDNTGVGVGPGPLRHPRPLTAADLHLQLEKEQEAVVNRLTRELSLLRAAQNASVVSNTSSTSAGLPDSGDHSSNHMLSGPSHPIPSQRAHHRSSSTASSRSTAVAGLVGSAALIPGAGTSGAINIAPTREGTHNERARMGMQRHDSNPSSQLPQSISLSRQNSAASSRRSGASSPAASGSYQHMEYFPHGYMHRPAHPHHRESSSSFSTSYSNTNPTPHGFTDFDRERERERGVERTSITSVPTTGRYEEAAFHRHELETVKRENEGLKKRIRELERMVRDASTSGRERSESASTSASIAPGRGRDLEKEEHGGASLTEDDGVRVGESARGGGLR